MVKKEMISGGFLEMHKKMLGWKALILGILLLLNAYLLGINWAVFFGWILVLIGLCKLVMPWCMRKKK